MTRQAITGATLMLALAGVGFLAAQDPKPRTVRISPSLLREAINATPVTTAASAPSLGHTIQDLRTLASDMEKAGHRTEADRLTTIVKNLTRLAERRHEEKKEQVEKLQAEMDELKWAADR